MKNFLVAIDFSKNAIHALEYALNYANCFGANLSMIWVDNCCGPDLLAEGASSGNRQEAHERFDEIQTRYQEKYPEMKLSFKLCKGKVYEEISRYAKKINADLLFGGTHGVSGFEEYWIGSNAYRIVTHAPCPVITLRQDFGLDKKIKKILMPIDNSSQSSRKVNISAEIATAFGAEVQVLALHTSNLGSLKKQVDRNLRFVAEHLNSQDVIFKVDEINTKNTTQDTIDFALNNNMDMVAIMTEQETTQANVFLGTFARQLVNNCPVPVLSVRMPLTGRT